jgi:hypothetical protein
MTGSAKLLAKYLKRIVVGGFTCTISRLGRPKEKM